MTYVIDCHWFDTALEMTDDELRAYEDDVMAWWDIHWSSEMAASTGPLDDQPRKKSPEIERKREWKHADTGPNKDCWRVARPIYTPPEKVPDECHSCPNDEWYSKGIVRRNKETKQIIDREDGSKR